MGYGDLPHDSTTLAEFLDERGEGQFRHEFKTDGEENEVVLGGIIMRFTAEYDDEGVATITVIPGTLVPGGLQARWDGAEWEPV